MGLTTINKEKTEYTPIPRDVYDIRLMDIEEKAGQYGPYWSWKFEVTEDPYAGRWLWIFTDNNVNPHYVRKGGKIGPRDLAATLLNRPLADNEYLDGEDYLELIDLNARGSVGIGPASKDGTLRNTLESVLPYKRNGAAGSPQPQMSTPLEKLADSSPANTDQTLFEEYLKLKEMLGWTKDVALQMIEEWTERAVTFQQLSVSERRLVLKYMRELDESQDLPFNSGGDKPFDDDDDAPELTAAGLVSPDAPGERKKKK